MIAESTEHPFTMTSPTVSDGGGSGRPRLTIVPGIVITINAVAPMRAIDSLMMPPSTVSGRLISAVISLVSAPDAPAGSVKSP